MESIFIDNINPKIPGELPVLEYSTGVVSAHGSDYEHRAFIARDDWKELTVFDADNLSIRQGINEAYNSIAIFTVPDNLATLLFEAINIQQNATDKLNEILTSVDVSIATWLEHSSLWRIVPEGFKGHGFKIDHATKHSATREAKTGKFVGLHIDSWDRLSLSERHQSQNRLCINLGKGERALQFIPIQARQMKHNLSTLASELGEYLQTITGKDSVLAYLGHFSETPVLRIKLKPGQAYIAPTENIIHDGCVMTDLQDKIYTYRGKIIPIGEG
jgi:hypothetical protein